MKKYNAELWEAFGVALKGAGAKVQFWGRLNLQNVRIPCLPQ